MEPGGAPPLPARQSSPHSSALLPSFHARHGSIDDEASSLSPLLALAPDLANSLYAFLPVADLLAFSTACRAAAEHVAGEQQHWRDLSRRLLPVRADSPKECYRAAFVRTAEAELQWRRGRPVAVRERRLAMGETGISQQRLQSMALWRLRGLLLAAIGDELGVFKEDGQDGDGGDDEIIASTEEPSLRVPVARYVAHEGSKVTAVRALPFGVATAGMDGRVKLLDWEGFGVREELDHHASAVWGLDAEQARSGAPILAASCFRRVTVSDLRQPQHHHPAISFQGHATWVRTLHMEMDRHLLVSGSADASCKSWDLRQPGVMQTKFVHPNHFEEVRSVQCRGDSVYTGCYDGIVREFDLLTGRVRRALTNHAPYAVEAAHVGGGKGGRLVSVDWSGVVACVPATDPKEEAGGAEDVEMLVYGRGEDAGTGRRAAAYRLCPVRDAAAGRLRYRRLGVKEEAPEVVEAHMSPSVGCLVHDEDRLLLGTADGRVISMLFRGGL